MLSFDQVDDLLQPLSDYFERFNQSVIEDMARRLTRMFNGQKSGLNSTLWQLNRLRESGALYDDILSRLGELTPYTEQELQRIFEQAGLKSIEHEHAIIKDLGRSVVSLEQSPEMINVLRASLIKTKGVLYNLTQTMPMAGQDQFIEVSDLAYEQVARGTLSIDEAVRQGVTGLAEQGINVINYSKGRVEKADVALLRNVRTGIVQTTGDMTLAMAGELGVDTVEVSAHAGARNKGTGPMNHAEWQGKVYSISGKDSKYPPLIESTGYGTAAGLLGINCRHSLFIFFEGVSTPEYTQAELDRINNTKVTYDGQQMDLYEATQKQRYIERQIRDWKRKAGALNAGGLDNTEERLKVGQWQAKARDFTKQTGLVRRYEWEQAAGANVRELTKRPVEVKEITKQLPKVEKETLVGVNETELEKNVLIKPEEIDFRSVEKDQYVADFGDQRNLYPDNEAGKDFAVDLPVHYNQFAARHLQSDSVHSSRFLWIQENANDFVRAIEFPEFIERAMRLRNDGHFSITNIVKVVNPGTEQWDYIAVAISLSKDGTGFHQITTIHPISYRQLYKSDGQLRNKYALVK